MSYSVVGTSVARRDAVEKVTGLANYTANLRMPRMLHAKILRSPLPHARILNIDASRARRLPGVRAVLTRHEIVDRANFSANFGRFFADQSVVAIERVRYVGDAVAAVAAVDRAAAEEALALITVEYEELPAVFSVEETLEPSAPVLHESFVPTHSRPYGFGEQAGTNICGHMHLEHGDLEAGFNQADYVFENEYTAPKQAHCTMEPHVAVADWRPTGRLTLWTSTQVPFFVRDQMTRMFHLPKGHVCVRVDNVGGGYGAKTSAKVEPVAAVLAKMSGCPVKMMLSREEVFLALTRHASKFHIRTGVSKDGRLVARQIRILWDTGAYADAGPVVVFKAGYTASGPYNIPNITIDSYCLYTNNPPAGPLRGMGVPQTTWGYEAHLDRIAAELGRDPIDLRRQNLFTEGDTFVSGETLRSIAVDGCFDKALAEVDWNSLGRAASSDPSKVRGRGVACAMKNSTTPSFSAATIRLNDDGTAVLLTGAVEIGQGMKTALAQMTAEALGLPLEHVTVATTNTDIVPFDFGTISGRTVFHVGTAINRAAEEIRQQLKSLGAEALEVAPDDLELSAGRVSVRGAPEKGLSYEEALLRRMGMKGSGLLGKGEYRTHWYKANPDIEGFTSPFWDMGVGIAEVEVDRETGQVRVLGYVCVADTGKAINPALVLGQLSGSTLMGIGQGLFEEMLFDNGQPINPSMVNYKIPSSRDIPEELQVFFIESGHHEGPYGAKGIGEIAVAPAAPAIANAIFDALGVQFTDMPITPEKILRAIDGSMAAKAAQN